LLVVLLIGKFEIKSKNKQVAGHWWLTPVILATGEAKIRRITVQSHPRQTDPISKIPNTK
jgi:hypothetical protein